MNGLELWDATEARHRGAQESVAANRRLGPGRKARQRDRVHRAIREAGLDGLTCRELADLWACASNEISGRFTELKAAGRITRLTDPVGRPIRRAGAAVYRSSTP